jgi:histidyl-tRNA synthetase
MRINTFPPSGTRDFFPKNLKNRLWLFDIWTKISKSYGYEQYDAPVVEYAELYTRKGGDDILNEMYKIQLGEISLALRPEMTPSLVRMIMQIYHTNPYKPIKWFSIPQCWRYETTIRGRKREHYQWNIDILGADSVKYEIELFLILVRFFRMVGLTQNDVAIHVSNRKILQKVLEQLGIPDELFEKACIIIDKIGKLTPEEFTTRMIEEIGMNLDGVIVIQKLVEIKTVEELYEFVPENDECLVETQALFNLAELVGIKPWLEFDVGIVRGLSYYTGLVFEGFFKNSEIKRAVCGGGRYDNLMQTYGYNEKIPAIGFGFGDVVILDVLEEMELLPQFDSDVEYVVVPFNDGLYPASIMVAEALREKNKSVLVYSRGGKRTNAFNYADRVGAKFVIFVAPDEWLQDESIVVKNLREEDKNKKQIVVRLQDYVNLV